MIFAGSYPGRFPHGVEGRENSPGSTRIDFQPRNWSKRAFGSEPARTSIFDRDKAIVETYIDDRRYVRATVYSVGFGE
jgi:hypothetical protein